MKQFQQVIEKDPLKLKKFDNSGVQVTSRSMYIFLVGIPVCLIISAVFYFLALLAGGHIEMPNQRQQQGSTSEFQAEGGELFQDTGKIANSFEKIQVAMRIMPTQNTEENMVIMHWTDVSNKEEAELGTKVDVGDHYFFVNDTTEYFPTLRYNADYAPFGNAISFCIHLQWIKKDMKKMYDMYKTVQGFSQCENAQNPKFRWQQGDPTTGVDFKVWTQEVEDVPYESACKGGVYRQKAFGDGGRCYTYNILKRICLMVAYTEHPETASYTWEYRGGCYHNGDIAVYEKAVPGTDYFFDYIPIEVREDESLYNSLSNTKSQVTAGLGPIFNILSASFLLLALLSGILFAYFYFQALKGGQGSGSSSRHQRQVDEPGY